MKPSQTLLPTAPDAERPERLERAMKPRQLTMMALGSAIGAGLFIGSGAGIQAAGPAVLVSYLVAGTLVILVMWALGEMAAAHPTSGAFSVYAGKALGPVAGAAVGWLWWLQLVVVIAAEALGAAGLLAALIPGLPTWLVALVFIVALAAVNLTRVKNFGAFEFWFALLKVSAIIAFLAVGAAMLFGLLPGTPTPVFENLTGHGGFAPHGLGGIATGLFVVIFAFGGTEIVAVAAAETKDPQRSIAKAVRTVVWRILVFYIGSLLVITVIVPWTSPALKSPFAAVLDAAGIPGGAGVITLVAVAALLSALNANLYGASRMVYSLAARGEAPRLLKRVSAQQVPAAAVIASVAFGLVAVALEVCFPDRVLPSLLNFVGSTSLIVWGSALLSQLVLRHRAERLGEIQPFRMAGFPFLTILGMALLASTIVIGLMGDQSRPQILSTLALVAAIAAGAWATNHWRGRALASPGPDSARG